MKIKYRMKNSERILLQFKDDERKGFRLLYDSFYDSLVLFATQFIGEAEEAADIVQECFVDFWVNRRVCFFGGSVVKYILSAVKKRFWGALYCWRPCLHWVRP